MSAKSHQQLLLTLLIVVIIVVVVGCNYSPPSSTADVIFFTDLFMFAGLTVVLKLSKKYINLFNQKFKKQLKELHPFPVFV